MSSMPIAKPAPVYMSGSVTLSHAGRAAIRYEAPATNGSTRPTTPPTTPSAFDAPG